jgi:hypothetical protein
MKETLADRVTAFVGGILIWVVGIILLGVVCRPMVWLFCLGFGCSA